MDVPGQSFSVNAPFRHSIVILHLSLMAIAFFGFYPIALIQAARRHRRYHFYTLTVGFLIALLGFVAGLIAQFTITDNAETLTLVRIILGILGYMLLALVVGQALLGLYQYRQTADSKPWLELDPSSWLGRLFPEDTIHLAVGWVVLVVAYAYLVVAAMAFTESCNFQASAGQCVMPLAIGSGFLMYGSLALLHLLSIFALPRSSTPEYYEGLVLTLWGLVCLIAFDTPILGSSWRAINLGLLWFAGGVFSVAVSVQTWMPALRERNIINALVICLTGQAIISGFTQNDPFASQIHQTLGYMLIIGAVARVLQIMFRKSPGDNLPRLISSSNSTDEFEDEEEDEEVGRANAYHATYRQLTGQQSHGSCKHKWIFGSVTVICGLLSSFLAMAVGILFMGANVQWIGHVRYYVNDPTTYINVTIATTFLWTTYVFVLCTIYRNIRPMSAQYYEYLGMSDITSSPEITSPQTPIPESHEMVAQRYEENRQLNRSRSLPARRNVEDPPAMRPSQYRAKRRSLLIQAPHPQDPHAKDPQRQRSSSGYSGVGGVLPDETNVRQSYISNASATSPGSATSFASSASSPPDHHRRTVVFSEEPANMAGDNTNDTNVRKTESGRRKERVSSKRRRRQLEEEDAQLSSSSSDSHSVAKYYSSERNSSDSHVC